MFVIEKEHLEKIKQIAKRLYTENRLNGDEMRDLAHTLTGILNAAIELP